VTSHVTWLTPADSVLCRPWGRFFPAPGSGLDQLFLLVRLCMNRSVFRAPHVSLLSAYLLFFPFSSCDVMSFGTPRKLVSSACYHTQQVCVHLQPFSCSISRQYSRNLTSWETRDSRLPYGENPESLPDLGLIRYRVVTPQTDRQAESP